MVQRITSLLAVLAVTMAFLPGVAAQVPGNAQSKPVATAIPQQLIGTQPNKELMIATMKAAFSMLQNQKHVDAANFFVIPTGMDASDLSGLIKKREISEEGIRVLELDAKFGTGDECFGAERARALVERMGLTAKPTFGFYHNAGDVTAEVLATWEDGRFRFIRMDDVGKLDSSSRKSEAVPATEPTAVVKTPAAFDPATIVVAIQELEKTIKANPSDANARAQLALNLFRLKSYPASWEQLMLAHKLQPKHEGIARGINMLVDQFTKMGVFSVGMPIESVEGLLGAPGDTVTLGKNRKRSVYGHWGIDFRENRVHEIVNLLGATEALYRPTETVWVDLDGRQWMTGFRRKTRGRVSAFMYIAGQNMTNFEEQIVIDRLLGASALGTMEEVANRQIADEKASMPDAKHKILEASTNSAMLAIELPSMPGSEARHQLVRLMRGPQDIHRLTYTMKSKEPPTQETQMKWFGIFKQAVLKDVK